MDTEIKTITDCACVIHGDAYSWKYVDRLYNMLSRHLTSEVRLHVYTEANRPVPDPYIKHELQDWGIGGPKQAWWYKLQLFNSAYHQGPMLYFDLDTVIVRNLDWILDRSTEYFWGIRDVKRLWKPTFYGINSSIMYWDTTRYDYIWKDFAQKNLKGTLEKYRGDQDYITDSISKTELRYFPIEPIKSWRWECFDGGYDFKNRCFYTPNTGTVTSDQTSVLIFHGNPKPAESADPYIKQHWQ